MKAAVIGYGEVGGILDHGKDSDGILTHRRCRAGLAQQTTAASDEGVH